MNTASRFPSPDARLAGVRVGCFYPWNPFEPTGAWSRFSCLWRYLLEQGATVTLCFLTKGPDAELKNLSVRFVGEHMVVNDATAIAKVVASARAMPELKHYSPVELDFLLRYEAGLYLGNPKTGPWLEQMISAQDVITCEYPLFAPLLSPFCRKLAKPLVVTSHDLLYELHGSHPRAKQRLMEKEVHALRLADALVFCNDQERLAMARHDLTGCTVLNTGDVLSVRPGQEEASRAMVRARLKLPADQYCLFLGSAHGPNAEAAVSVRQMAKKMPEMLFLVAGNCCAPAVDGNFVSIGHVTEQLLDLLYRGAFAIIVPLERGTGISVKFFQAFIYAKPVIATPIGARGHAVAADRELMLVETPADFPAALRRLQRDPDLRAQIAQRGRAYAEGLDFRRHFAAYGEIINRLVLRRASAATPLAPALILVDNNLSDRVGHHFNYALALKEQCVAQDNAFHALIKSGAAPEIQDALGATPTFTQGIHEESSLNPYPPDWGSIRATYDFLLSNATFADELERGLAQIARTGDTVFLPNASPRQVLGLALLLLRNPIYRTLRYVLIFRYSLQGVAGPITARKTARDVDSFEKHEIAIGKLLSADQSSCVRLATDSEALAREYEPLAKRPVEVLPIPHTGHQLPTAWPAGVPPKDPRKLRVVFLGDAREEKGFEFLPAVLRGCAAGVAAVGTEFVFQAFITSRYHARMGEVIAELDELKLPNVHLLKAPLGADAYQALLQSADLVLLPYDAATYQARTSGPFVEAICANKPVVVPRDSWMSAQLGDSRAGVTFASGNAADLARAVVAALKNISLHTAAAVELGGEFRSYHNPQNFVAQLIAAPVEHRVAVAASLDTPVAEPAVAAEVT